MLNKIENEGVHLLSLSEILQVKTHLQKNHDSEKDVNFEMINQEFESEKNKLIQEVFELRDLLSKITVRIVTKTNVEKIMNIFFKKKLF